MADSFLAETLCQTKPLTFISMPGAPAHAAELGVASPNAALQVPAPAAQPEALPSTTRPEISAPAVRSEVSAAVQNPDPPTASVRPAVSELEEGEIREQSEAATLEQVLHASKQQTPFIKLEEPELGEGDLREQVKPTVSEPVIHHARRQLMESDEPREVQREVRQRWAPTGGNMHPLGMKIKSESPGQSPGPQFDPPVRASPRYMTSRDAVHDLDKRPFPSYMFDRCASSVAPPLPPLMTRPEGLMYPVERYLPPAGIYYDELALPNTFDASFFKFGHCGICWSRHPADFYSTTCAKKCKVCGTQRHKDESCPLFYCTAKWYLAQGIPYLPETLRSRQIRPDEQEQVILRRMGVLSEARGVGGIIVANEDHRLVQAFYKGRASPKAMVSLIVDAKRQPAPRSAFITTADGPSFVSNVQAQAPLPPPPARSCHVSSSFVNSNRNRLLQSPTSSGELAGPVRTPPEAANVPKHATTTATQDSEDKLQEKELEILRLRMEAIVKDREIRKLKMKNETLRAESEKLRGRGVNTGNTYETGSKRRRL